MRRLLLLFVAAFIIVFLGAFAGASVSFAEDVTISWENPTASESCSDATGDFTVAGTRIWQLVAETDSPIEQVVLENQLPGEYQYKATSYTTEDAESRLTSGSLTKTVTSFKAASGAQVFQPVTINAGFWMIPMGTLTADTDCDVGSRADSSGTTYYRISLDNVEWLPNLTVEPVMVVAECG